MIRRFGTRQCANRLEGLTGGVAQWIARRTSDPKVKGSIPFVLVCFADCLEREERNASDEGDSLGRVMSDFFVDPVRSHVDKCLGRFPEACGLARWFFLTRMS